jgi:hypothetical protein
MPGAVLPFRQLRSRLRPARIDGVNTLTKTSRTSSVPSKHGRTPEPTDLIFPKWQRELFKTILNEKKLRFDREGRPRTAYSLRHTHTHTSACGLWRVPAHIPTLLDAAAINVMRPKKSRNQDQTKVA